MIDEAKLRDFKNDAITCLEKAGSAYPWLEKHGDIIQCQPSALRPGDFYVMGFNPGGTGGETVLDTTTKLSLSAPPRVDPSGRYWNNLSKLSTVLGLGSRWESELLVTNLFPDRSEGISKWKANHETKQKRPALAYVDSIWPLHELMLSIVQPRFIIVSGMGHRESAFRWLWDRFKHPDDGLDETMWKGTEGDPQIKSFSSCDRSVAKRSQSHRVTFIGIPHLSYRAPNDTVIPKLIAAERKTFGL